LTVRVLAEVSNLSENYLYQKVRSGELVASRCGRAIRIAERDFEAFMAERRQEWLDVQSR
jgi:excisionase family DNA binding protein